MAHTTRKQSSGIQFESPRAKLVSELSKRKMLALDLDKATNQIISHTVPQESPGKRTNEDIDTMKSNKVTY